MFLQLLCLTNWERHKNPVALFYGQLFCPTERLPQAVRFAGGDGGVEGNQGRLVTVTMNTQLLEETPELSR